MNVPITQEREAVPASELITYGSVCSGIEAPSSAWHPLGWKPLWFSEIELFPKAVLAHHYPDVPDLGDMTALPGRILAGEVPAPDVFVGGTPCQSFSVAGLRRGLADPRGQLTRTFVEILDALDTVRTAAGKPPAIALWENVPGVLSDKDNAFGNFLAALVGEDDALLPPGGRWSNCGCVLGPTRVAAWRVLDAQYFGVAQRRRRVFVVVSARSSGVDPVEVLLVEQGVRRDTPPSREAWQGAPTAAARGAESGGRERGAGSDGGRGRGVASWTFRSDAMREGTAKTPSADAEGRIRLRDPGMGMYEEIAPTLDCGQPHGVAHAVAFTTRGRDDGGRGRGGGVAHVAVMPTMVSGGSTEGSHNQLSGQLREQYIVPHVVAPPLTATNDPSRSPQSAEVTAQVEAVLRATHSSSIGIDTYNGTITGNVAATLSTGSATTTGSGPSVLQPRATFWNGSDIAEALTCTSDDQRMPDKGRMQMVLQTTNAHAHAVHENQRAEVRLSPVVGTLKCAGGKLGQGYPTVLAEGAAVPNAVPYDLFQVTAPVNRQNRDERSPCHTLARDNAAHAAVVLPGAQHFDVYNHRMTGDVAGIVREQHGTNMNAVLQPIAFHPTQDPIASTDGSTHCMGTGSRQGTATVAVAFNGYQRTEASVTWPLMAGDARKVEVGVRCGMHVRRLTPVECERLQGFPDNHTLIPWKGKPPEQCPDGPRYRALGNSMAVPVIRWIGRKLAERIALASSTAAH